MIARKTDPFACLEVFDRLEVGPVRLEPDRLIMPHVVSQGGKTDRTDLVYRYEEPVFQPEQEIDRNLAGLIGAQVAINYGLFCKQIRFHGLFDKIDRRWLGEALRMTAQEILAIKFLQPNPFLQGPAAHLQPAVLKDYLRSEPEFDPVAYAPQNTPTAFDTTRDRCAVMSSGGKESLLTFGVLREIGQEVHPIFINESGRHWLTALNAHRHFSERFESTSRVWTNADRLFTWMLRRMPFIRTDFAQQRADIYPVRLWTVAVFTFGSLPLLRKRGIGRLVIGDEYDTTVRAKFHGIGHYAGLYDQSRYFDNAMSRFFSQKRYPICQFSVLRPLSELLVEKILIERYPDLLHQQVSCHAAHVQDGRVKPCGNCEKCRRVVSLLEALGADANLLGYDPEQIKRCLKMAEKKGLHHEDALAGHLAFMLSQAGRIDQPRLGETTAREQPEVLKLRFDGERSPFDATPVALRQPIWHIFLEHTDGAVRRQGRLWKECNPLRLSEASRPYAFDKWWAPGTTLEPDFLLKQSERDIISLGQLTWPQAEERFSQVDVALLPVGAIEQHGPHLPLDTDAFDAHHLASQVAMNCRHPKPLVLPLIPYGVSYHHGDFAGTISISPDALSRIVYEVGMSVSRYGITKLVIINGHGGNTPALQFAAQMINRDAHIFSCVDSGETSDADLNAMTETKNDVHAGEAETSTALAIRPELVRMEAAVSFIPAFSNRYLDFSSRHSVEWYAHTARISATGVLGDPTRASADKGKRMWKVMVSNLVEFIEHLKSLSLDEIHQRRY